MMPAGMRYCVLMLFVNCACTFSSDRSRDGSGENPPSPGFDLANSDPAAVELADSIMVAMGGRASWDDIRFVSWSFDGQRQLFWDRRSDNVRIESLPDSTVYLFRPEGQDGRVQVGGEEIIQADSLSLLMRKARRLWMNDSLWLMVLLGLKGDGVTLKYQGERRTDSARYNLLQITVSAAGKMPPGEYLAYVDLEDNLIKLCSELDHTSGDASDFLVRWDNYRSHGSVLLPAFTPGTDGPHDVRVHRRLPGRVFEDF